MAGPPIRILEPMTVKNGMRSWGAVHRELVAPCLSSDVEWVQREVDVPVAAISSKFECDLAASQQALAALEAEREGFHAVVLGCLFQPGVTAAKEICTIPIVSDLEAALHMASLVARKFSFVKPGRGPADTQLLQEIIESHGFGHRLASIRCINAGSLDFAAEQPSLKEATLSAARAAIEEDGAQAIVGYGGLTLLNYLRSHLDVPVIHPVQSAAAVAEMMARLGLSMSKLSYPIPARLPTVLAALAKRANPAVPEQGETVGLASE